MSQTNRAQNALLASGLLVLVGILSLQPPTELRTYTDGLRAVSGNLKGQFPYADVATTVLSWRAMRDGRDPYVPLTEHFRREGIDWNLPTASTHPPTTFLFVAPFASLSLSTAVAIWAWLMLALLSLSYVLLGCPPRAAVGLGCLSLLWPPVMLSLGQLTIVWLLGVTLAIRISGAWRGAAIALASMTKVVPALILLPLLLRRHWRDVAGFTAAWIVALLLVTVVSTAAIGQYVRVNRTNAIAVSQRPDNAAPLVTAHRLAGATGVVAVLLIAGLVGWIAAGRSLPEQLLLANYVTVLLLPIAWIYSACVLIPLWRRFLTAGPSARAWCTGTSVLILLVGPSFGSAATIPIATALLLPGAGLLMDTLPSALPFWAKVRASD